MRNAPPVFREGAARHMTLAAHTQAVERAIQTMHTHLHEVLTLEDLASVACLSPSHFTRVFCRLIDIPPGEFLSALRFQAARRLLLTTSLSVTDICFEVGYTSTGSFTSRFTHLVGLFTGPIPQGRPVRCTTLSSPGLYLLNGIADGVYHLRAAAFPVAADLQSSLLPGEQLLVGKSASPLVIHHGHVAGDPDLVLHPPRLTDPPLVMGLPLLCKEERTAVQKEHARRSFFP